MAGTLSGRPTATDLPGLSTSCLSSLLWEDSPAENRTLPLLRAVNPMRATGWSRDQFAARVL